MYKVVKNGTDFSVVETATEQTIKTLDSHEKAHALYRKLKGGRGFQGNTPSFFLKEFKIKNE